MKSTLNWVRGFHQAFYSATCAEIRNIDSCTTSAWNRWKIQCVGRFKMQQRASGRHDEPPYPRFHRYLLPNPDAHNNPTFLNNTFRNDCHNNGDIICALGSHFAQNEVQQTHVDSPIPFVKDILMHAHTPNNPIACPS